MLKTLKTSVLASGFWRLKAPRWHLGALWVSDMRAGKVFRIDLDGKVTIVADVPSQPSGLGFLPDGSLLVASMTQRLILKFGAEKPTVHADLTDVASGYLRDLVVARDGNAYVTSFDANASGPDCFASARVLLTTPDGNIRSVADSIAHPNGLAITSAHDLLVAETLGNRLLAFKIGQRRNIAASNGLRELRGDESARPLRGLRRRRLGSRCPTAAFCPRTTGRACHSSRSCTGPSCGRVSIGRTRRSDAFLH